MDAEGGGAGDGARGPHTHAALRRLLLPSARGSALWADVDPAAPVASPVLAGLEGPLRALARRLSPQVMSGAYTLILVDDTSARLPALILREIFNRRLVAAGRQPLPIVFWQTAGKTEHFGAMTQALEARRPALEALGVPPGRVLLITEWICGGYHLRAVAAQLAAAGIEFDAATFGTSRGALLPPNLRLFSSHTADYTVNGLFPNPPLTGLTREKYAAAPVLRDPEVRATMRSARRDAHILAARIAASL